ncbi:LLM class flavin-dependent oxidoreductase [Pedomonas sp. V897]|uniref:LLM class flavin-dependent oxidoreductase n=1 Tax=Pedomonas sp. V897 TaxID=3446482 RepID=UPI003EE1420C
MTIQIHWQLDVTAEAGRSEPSARPRVPGVARDVRTPALNRYDYYAQVARAAALTGFDGLFIPYREDGDDSQIVAAALARTTPRLRLVPEFPASAGSAVYAAKQAATFQRFTHQRLGWAIAPDGDDAARARRGDQVAAKDLAERLDEFLTVARAVHRGPSFTFKGRFFEVQNGGFAEPLNRVAFPTVYLRGTEEERLKLSARHADVHLLDAAPADELKNIIEVLGWLALQQGRSVAAGLIQPVLARETAEEAEAARRDAGIADDAPVITGSYDDVAARLADLASLGIRHFVLTATPGFEEAYRIGQFVLPRLRALTGSARAAA